MKPFLITEAMKERYSQNGYWGTPTLIEVFEKNAAKYPEKEIFVDSSTRLTFSEAQRYVERLALGLLDMGFKKDDVLVVQLPNIVESALLRLALYNSGILPLLIMVAFNANEVRHLLNISGARGIVIPPRFGDRDYLQMVQEIRPELPSLEHVFMVGDEVPAECVSIERMMQRPIEKDFPTDYLKDKRTNTWEVQELMTSSGSTGLPKTSENYGWHQALGRQLCSRWRVTDSDVVGLAVPFAGGLANNAWVTAITGPCKLAFLEKFNPTDALKLIEREKVTIFMGVPAIGEMFVRAENLREFDISSLRVFFSSGAPMPPSLAPEIESKMDCVLVGLLGNTDFGPIAVTSVDDPVFLRHNSVGRPLPGNELRVVNQSGEDVPPGEEGELWCRGPYAATGYYKMPEATLDVYGGEKDGWFRTGDLAKIDQEGYLYIVGRLKDQIKRGGMAIAPVEIEDMLRNHPKVKDVAVVSMPDPILGEKVCAFVIPQPGPELTFDEMVTFLREKKLATFKLPERLELIAEFPTVAGQKISKKGLTEIVTAKLKAEGKV